MESKETLSLFTGKKPLIIAGPCSAESLEQVLETAHALKKNSDIKVFRAGIWKPRTRPNNFEGLGEIALPWLKKVKNETGLKTACEVASSKHVELALKNDVDILWIGARTTVNPFSVQEIADALRGTNKTIMIKNPINADLQLWIGAFERLKNAGIKNLIAIHRGFSVGEHSEFRNNPLWKIPIELKMLLPDVPLLCDPSHITGNRNLILKVAQKALDLNMDGLMIETHPNPDLAWSDRAQQLTPNNLLELLAHLKVKTVSASNFDYEHELESLREEIDRIDHEIIEALRFRKNIVSKIASKKLENNITALQTKRYADLMLDRIKAGNLNGLHESFIKEIFGTIHEESLKIQTDIFNNLQQ